MTMMILASIIGLILLVSVLAPFFTGSGGTLQAGSSVLSEDQINGQKAGLLQQYVDDEKAFKDGVLSAREWKARQSFILGRYIDASRRFDYLQFIKKNSGALVIAAALALSHLFFPHSALAEGKIFMGDRHLMMLRPGIDAVWGTSVFAVVNEGTEPVSERYNVLLPKETIDFSPQEGVTPEELKQNTDGTLYVEKLFPPGTNVISIGFMVAGNSGNAALTFVGPPGDSRAVALLSSKGILTLGSPNLNPAKPDEALPTSGYDQYVMKEPLAPGVEMKVSIAGIPEGRKNFWILGGCVGALLFSLGGGLAWRRRPKLGSDE